MKKLFALALCATSAISMAGGSVPKFADHRRARTYFTIDEAHKELGVKEHSTETEKLTSKLFQCENADASTLKNCADGIKELAALSNRLKKEKSKNKKLIANLLGLSTCIILEFATIPKQSEK
jgi:hypothetical protein